MKRRLLLLSTAILAAPIMLAACGDDDDVATEPGSDPPAPTDGQGGAAIEHPTGSDEVVLSYVVDGGFVPVGVAFSTLPTVVVTGDGTVYTVGPQTLEFPGKLLPNVLTQQLDEDGLAALLAAAGEAGLIGRNTSSSPTNVADAATTTLTINADGGPWVHEHYALEVDDPDASTEEDRAAVAAFTTQLTDLATLVGAEHISQDAPAPLERFAVSAVDAATAADPSLPQEPQAWPADGPDLAGLVNGCAEVDGAAWADLFAEANQLTPFTAPDGAEYIISVRPLYPGVEGCA